MTFQTVPGSNGQADSFFGTSGVDSIDINSRSSGAFVGARQADDSISLSGDADKYTINGGIGNDTVRAQGASFTNGLIHGDGGNETINLLTASGSTIKGLDGSDTITIGGATSGAFINGNAGDDTLHLNAAMTNATVFGGIGVDNANISTAFGGNYRANEGNDTVTINASTHITDALINGNQGDDTITVNALSQFTRSTIHGGIGQDTLAATNAGVGILFDGDEGHDTATAGAGTDTLIGGAGNDRLTGNGGVDSFRVDSGTDTITDLSGTDEFRVTNGATANATITAAYTAGATASNGGTFNGTVAAAVAANSVISFASIIGGVGVTVTTDANAQQVIGSSFVDTLTGLAGNDTITGGGGADNVNGGTGNNFFRYTATADLFTGNALVDSITGGAANDTIILDANAFTIANADSFATRNAALEGIAAGGASTGVLSITLNTNAQAAGLDFINLSADTDVNGTNVVDLSNFAGGGSAFTTTGSAGSDSLTGNANIDTITGGAGADTIVGGNGADRLIGGNGIDSITGGGGNDVFSYDGVAAAGNAINIADFAAGGGGDEIALTNTAGVVAGTDAGALVNVAGLGGLTIDDVVADTAANLGAAAVNVGNRSAVFTGGGYAVATDTGALFFDADGDFRTGVVAIGVITVGGGAFAAGDFQYGI